jgi:hypothetical protein
MVSSPLRRFCNLQVLKAVIERCMQRSAPCLCMVAPQLKGFQTLQVLKAVIERVGAERVGIRLSPYGTFLQDELDEDGTELALHLIAEMRALQPLYLHFIEARAAGTHVDVHMETPAEQSLAPFRKAWPVLSIAHSCLGAPRAPWMTCTGAGACG